jgi:hypothetical protein
MKKLKKAHVCVYLQHCGGFFPIGTHAGLAWVRILSSGF